MWLFQNGAKKPFSNIGAMLLDIYKTVESVIPRHLGPLEQTTPCPKTIADTLYGWRLWASEPSSRDILQHIMKERRGHENPAMMTEVVKALMQEPLYSDLVAWGKLSYVLTGALHVTVDRGPYRYVWNIGSREVAEDIQLSDEKGSYTWAHPSSEWKAQLP